MRARVWQVPEKFALVTHLESRGFKVVAAGVVDGNLKIYFYGSGVSSLSVLGFVHLVVFACIYLHANIFA